MKTVLNILISFHFADIAELKDHDTVVVTMQFPSGVLAHIDISRHAVYGYDQRLEVHLLRVTMDTIKRVDRIYFFLVRCDYIHIHSPLLTFFLCFFILFQSCCSHAQVFGRTLVHEFPIFYSHTEWNLTTSLYDNSENILKVECY